MNYEKLGVFYLGKDGVVRDQCMYGAYKQPSARGKIRRCAEPPLFSPWASSAGC